MGYAEHLKTLLRPLGVYALDAGYGAAEIAALGDALDAASQETETLERECTAATAETYGLENYEDILPKRPVYRTLATRRNALMALLAIDDGSFTSAALNGTLAGCGIPAEVRETGTRFTVEVSFPGTKGVPTDIDRLKARVESILPCHLAVTYVYNYTTWAEVEEAFPAWSRLAGITWAGLESYGSL